MFIVFIVVFIDLLGFGIVLPIMPRLAEHYMKGMSAQAQGAVIGALFSSFSLMQFIFSPVLGRISDRIGRRPILMLGLAGSVIFYALFGFAASLPESAPELALVLMLVSRIGAGIAGASVSTAAAVIADCTTPEKRARGMALIGAAFGIGFTFGPLIAYAGLKLFEDQKWGVGAIASGLSLLALIFAAVKLPETLRPNANLPPRHFFSLGRTLEVLRMPTVGPLVLIYFLVIFAFANFEATLALFTHDAFGMNDEQNFLLFAGVGAVLMVAQGGLYRPLAGKWPETQLMTLGIGLMLLGMGGLVCVAWGAYMLRPSPGAVDNLKFLFCLSGATAVTGFAFVNPSVSALVSKRTDPTRQGEVLGVNQSGASLGRILGPFIGSVVFKEHDSRILPYAAAAAVLLFVVGLLPLVKGPSVATKAA
ncbi:putative multidrug resistance protein [Fimbriiglobus ruber]|uniref:Putative multidrug resistance protein n=2 Tax=Fimbriiglobus ruber TaxID=1908690 RepID=A0A225DQB5_9BACT|nr:putative multidrug resistance protein [Fimbriiglobus ruber]